MPETVYVYLFILCAISHQGIDGALQDKGMGTSSNNVFVRGKRVISRDLCEDVPVAAGAFPYVVNIKIDNRIIGVGSILSPRTAITAAAVMIFTRANYLVSSASTYSYLGDFHNVTSVQTHLSFPYGHNMGISLLHVNPPFRQEQTGIVGIHIGPVLSGMHGTVLGWANGLLAERQQTRHPRRLRAITVPIMNHHQCVNIYRGMFAIREEDVCTYHEQKQCGSTDVGAPLVIDNELAGVHIGIVPTSHQLPIKPDIFILLQHAQYNRWIRSHILH